MRWPSFYLGTCRSEFARAGNRMFGKHRCNRTKSIELAAPGIHCLRLTFTVAGATVTVDKLAVPTDW
ncbi:hypothetical protein RB195_013185 [Necator americanus]|uniref:Uncharacterized protein n=1 Tax=Necator americanus TaxID=51031 RepID=A0ABR1DUD8_NECAM